MRQIARNQLRAAMTEHCELPSPERALRDLRFYAERLCVDKPERYEVYQTAGDGTTCKLSDAIQVLLAAFPPEHAVAYLAQRDELAAADTQRLGAERLAGAVCAMIDRGMIDARSEAGDALLDYASALYGDSRPIEHVRERYAEIKR